MSAPAVRREPETATVLAHREAQPLFPNRQAIEPPYTSERPPLSFAGLVVAADTVGISVSFCVAYAIRTRLEHYGSLRPLSDYAWILGIVIPLWIALTHAAGLTSAGTYKSLGRTLLLTLRVHAIAGLTLLSALYLLKAVDVSRLLIQTFLIVSVAALAADRVGLCYIYQRLAKRWEYRLRRLLIVGTTAAARELQRLVLQKPEWGVSIVGLVASDDVRTVSGGEIPVLGSTDDIESLLDTREYDEVVMADAKPRQDHSDAVAGACLERGLAYHTLVRIPAQLAEQFNAEELGDGLYLISLHAARHDPAALCVKRIIDIVGACVGLVWCAATYVIVAPLIRLGSSGPVIFSQTRVGRNGRRFTLYKFRTMDADAEAQKASLQASNEMIGHLFKLRDDPRVTPIGRFLRRTYLDELPQFWNVLRGDMSLVGTRPPTPEEVAQYSPHHRRRLSVRPGITGLWQSMGNGKVWDFEVVVKLDCEYIDRWSIWLDLHTILRTCLVVIRGAGH